MGTAIQFAVRDGAGGVQHGSVAGQGQSNFIQVGSGDSVSLNVSRASVVGYEQQGRDLIVKLTDGRSVVLSGYFDVAPGDANHLFLSHDDQIVEVIVRDSGNGMLFADYGPVQGFEKWSPLDNLKFSEGDPLASMVVASSEPAGMGPLIPGLLGLGGMGSAAAAAAVIGGGAAIIGGGGGGGNGGGRATPTVDPAPERTVTTKTTDPALVVTGTGEPGDTVVVTIGDKSQTTVIEEDGTWGVTFPGTDLPADGEYTAGVVVTTPDGNIPLTGPEFLIDLTPPPVDITGGAKSNGDVENLAEYQDGVSITGTGEVGAKIEVTVAGSTQTTTVGQNGTWTVTFPTTQITTGEYETGITVTATDINGNTTIITDTLVVDTVPNSVSFNSVTTDNVVNLVESNGVLTLTGSATAGATITFTIAGVSQTATAGADGKWSASWPANTLTGGTYNSSVSFTTTDTAGNVTTGSHAFKVDTTTSVAFSSGPVAGDNIVNLTESTQGVVLTGSSEPGASVSVTWQGQTLPATVAADGSWTVTFATVTTGTYSSTATVTATDAAGNTASATRSIAVDTETFVTLPAGQAGGDDTISGIERGAGITLTGSAEAGASVVVNLAGVVRTVTAGANGVWSANFATAELPTGTTTATATVTATDSAGNTATATRSIAVDTEVSPFTQSAIPTGSDAVLNKVESAAGVTISGTVEPGSTVSVMFGATGPYAATVSGGTWSVQIPAGAIPQGGNNTVAITANATDRLGNTATLNSTVKVDTLVENFTLTGQIGGDGYINAQERVAGVPISGTVEPGSSVLVDLGNGKTLTTTASSTGLWSVTVPAADLPSGDGVALNVKITATDLAGNTSEIISRSVIVDTVAPDAPDVTNIVRNAGSMNGLFADIDGDAVTFHQVNAAGSTSSIGVTKTELGASDLFTFSKGVPDGSYLVIENSDVAGNSASTLFIVNNTNTVTVDLNRAGLADFDFTKIDLTLAPQASLTITEAQLKAITGDDHRLTIAGDTDDSVTIIGGSKTGTTRVDGEDYNIYTLGSGTTLLVDDDINITTIV